jgi:DNA invertase Pin-like site-specific DNA recombinase
LEVVDIYTRLSNEDKDKVCKTDDSESIQNQKTMLVNYCVTKGWDIHKIYCDDDYSGIDRDRPEFNQMIDDCRNGLVDIVLCKSQSRFSRDMEIIERYIHGKFLEWKVRFVSVVDNADTSVAGNKKSRQINSLINEWYLEDLSENIKRTLKTKRENGQFVGAFAPYGYLKDPSDRHKLIIDPVASEVVKEIFGMYSIGYGRQRISKILNDRKIPTPYEHKISIGLKYTPGSIVKLNARIGQRIWHDSFISNLLKNETYIGNLVQGKKTHVSYKNKTFIKKDEKDWAKVVGTHEPIISEEIWNKCLELRKFRHRPQKYTNEIYILSGKIFCAECGTRMAKDSKFHSRKDGTRYNYARCNTVIKFYKKVCGNFHSINLDKLEKIVIEKINSLLKNYAKGELISINETDDVKKKQKALGMDKKKILAEKAKKESHLASLL